MDELQWIRMVFLLTAASFASSKPLSMDQAIASAAEEVGDVRLLSDDASVLVELDMRFSYEQWRQIQAARAQKTSRRKKRKALRNLAKRWDDGVVPYTFLPGFSDSNRALITSAMKEWERLTCITFRPANDQEASITFVPRGGCSSYVGRLGSPGQTLTLGPNCLQKGVIMHELGHAMGFIHEHSRPDRDRFVTIQFRNVKNGMEGQFQKFPASVINLYGVPYDYRSIMHYGPYYFSKNQQATIKTKVSSANSLIGNRYNPSFNDIRLANFMYSCSASCGQKDCPDGFLGKDCECWCKGGDSFKYCTPNANRTEPPTASPPPPPTAAPNPDENKPGDVYRQCGAWAAREVCRTRPTFMRLYCAASCEGLLDRCSDVNPRICRRYASTCRTWPVMQRYCRRTCGLCTFAERNNSCIDISVRTCRAIAVSGLCSSSNPTVQRNAKRACPQACGACVRTDPGKCEDKSPRNCPIFKAQGRCNTTRQSELNVLRKVCAKSCNLCSKPQGRAQVGRVRSRYRCQDRLRKTSCQKFVTHNKCRYPPFLRALRIYCKRTCGFCTWYGSDYEDEDD